MTTQKTDINDVTSTKRVIADRVVGLSDEIDVKEIFGDVSCCC